MKLSKVQLEVIEYMRKGWGLHRDMTFDGRINLTNPDPYHLEWKRVSVATWFKLYKLGLIKLKSRKFPTEVYELTEEKL